MYLYLVNSTLHRIGPAIPVRYSDSLLLLDLGNVGLSEIHRGAFAGLSSLKWLFLHDNRLYELHADDFDGLTSLVWLNLRGNGLQVLQADGCVSRIEESSATMAI